MHNILKFFRYCVFSVFVICNAIVASIAVWNLSIAKAIKTSLPVDIYLVFVGVSGLLLIFSLIFIELAWKHVFTSEVWFECCWVGLYWILYLAGAVSLSAIAPLQMCSPQAIIAVNDSCSSTQALQAFSWISTLILMAYFSFLLISSIILSQRDPRIWHSQVGRYSWSETRSLPQSPPRSPGLPTVQQRKFSIVAPRPRRLENNAPIYAYRSGLSSYEIEHFRPPTSPPKSAESQLPDLPLAASAPLPARGTQVDSPPINQSLASMFYPQYMQSTFVSRPPPVASQPLRALPPSPPPLGDWPRANATSQPVQTKRNQRLDRKPSASKPRPRPLPPTTATTSQSPPIEGVVPPTKAVMTTIASSEQPGPSRPRGPRRSSGDARPVALNMSSISSYRDPYR